jgi:hypothetical protein
MHTNQTNQTQDILGKIGTDIVRNHLLAAATQLRRFGPAGEPAARAVEELAEGLTVES